MTLSTDLPIGAVLDEIGRRAPRTRVSSSRRGAAGRGQEHDRAAAARVATMVRRQGPGRRAAARRHPRRGDTHGRAAQRAGGRSRRVAHARRHQRLQGHAHRGRDRGCPHADAPLGCRAHRTCRRSSSTSSTNAASTPTSVWRSRSTHVPRCIRSFASLVMSATLDGAAVARLLDDAPIIECAHRQYPIATTYLGATSAIVRRRPRRPGHAARAARG